MLQPAVQPLALYDVPFAGIDTVAVGAVPSTVQLTVAGLLTFPAASVAVTATVWVPSARPL